RVVRAAAGEDAVVIGDANGAWEPTEADGAIAALEAGTVDWIEQPVRGIEAMRTLARRTDVRIALDEDATDAQAFSLPPCAGAACLKLQAWGGPDRLLEAADSARSAGIEVYLGSTFEGPVGIAASLHCAAAIGPDLPSGLATLDSFDQRFPGVEIGDGSWLPTDRPGIGVDPDGNPA
ncbi:MAG: enolase C-terminal domain-like protein, partial [Actinomycetes bacterium]